MIIILSSSFSFSSHIPQTYCSTNHEMDEIETPNKFRCILRYMVTDLPAYPFQHESGTPPSSVVTSSASVVLFHVLDFLKCSS